MQFPLGDAEESGNATCRNQKCGGQESPNSSANLLEIEANHGDADWGAA
jgi:hypothetical protein